MTLPGQTINNVNDLLAVLVHDGHVIFDGQKYLAESIFDMTFSFVIAAVVSEKFKRYKQ
jgi:hypothetical protein